MRAFFLLLLACLARPAVSVYFIYPPAFEATTNFSTNIVMVEGEFKDVQWADVTNPNNSRISITMWQLNGTQFIGDSEYIIQNAAYDTVSTSWTVNTNKNLTLSPMFYMNLFLEGETTSLTNSHYFNITTSSTTSTTTTSKSSSSTSSTSAAASTTARSSSISSTTATANPATTSAPVTIAASSALSTGAKAGIAVGVIGAALLGLLAGWLVLGRQKKMNDVQQAAPTSHYEPVKMEQQSPQFHHELGSDQLTPGQYTHEVSGDAARYELSPESRHELPP